MQTLLDILSWACILAGGFVGVTGAVGLFRFPDFYTRMHAASMTDTLTTGLLMLGLILQSTDILMVLKLVLIMFRMSFCAVPAFMRVLPVMNSGPTMASMGYAAVAATLESALQTMAPVTRPVSLACLRPPMT